MSEPDRVKWSRVAANEVAIAMRAAKAELPDSSERRLLLLVLTNAASSCGMLRIDFEDVKALIAGAYQQGLQQPELPPGASLFDVVRVH
jgi:hypothetical protein